tara:strand:+ start:491 stop:757 length:267 start_codon:yes stop_codon:yes gene_type:complete
MGEDLQSFREQIDSIDEQILKLLEKRMDLVRDVGKLKAKLDLAVEDLNREKEIIERLTKHAHGHLSEGQLIRIFTAVFKSSKQLQRKN